MADTCSVTRRSSITWPIVVGIVLAVLASFAPALSNGFVDWDDDLNLTDNPAYRGLSSPHLRWMVTTTLGGHWQPLTWLSFAVDHALFGMDPRGYHATNLILHAANAVLVWLVLLALLEERGGASDDGTRRRAAAFGALLFAIHPLRVESVAWATERRDVLSGLFWLLALLAYLRAARNGRRLRWYGHVLVFVALALSLGAKAWGMTFPLVLLILDAYPLGRLTRFPVRACAEKIPVAVLAALGGAIAFTAQTTAPDMRSLGEHGLAARAAQGAYGLMFYLVKTVAPFGLYPAYLLEPTLDPTAPRYVAALLLVVVISVVAVLTRRRAPWMLAAWTSYVVILGPVLGFAQTGPQLVADRYTYLACLPWVALAAAGAAHLRSSTDAVRPVVAALAGALLLALGILTFRQTEVWHDSISLWDHTLAVDPCNWMALTNRGFARTDPAGEIADYTEAIRCNPGYYLPYFNRGNSRRESGDLAGAADDFSRVIALRPSDPSAYNNRGWVRLSTGDYAGAVADYERALALAPLDWRQRLMVLANLATARARIAAVER